LAVCRSPFDFVVNHWRDGATGVLRMGLSRGLYCLGCCWILMRLLFVGGVMNLLWVAVLAAVVLVEKLLPLGLWMARISGVLLAAYPTIIRPSTITLWVTRAKTSLDLYYSEQLPQILARAHAPSGRKYLVNGPQRGHFLRHWHQRKSLTSLVVGRASMAAFPWPSSREMRVPAGDFGVLFERNGSSDYPVHPLAIIAAESDHRRLCARFAPIC